MVAVADVDAEKDAYGVVTVVHILLRLFLLRKEWGKREGVGEKEREREREHHHYQVPTAKLLSTIATCVSISPAGRLEFCQRYCQRSPVQLTELGRRTPPQRGSLYRRSPSEQSGCCETDSRRETGVTESVCVCECV